jgi:hypothetical protein
MRIRVIVPLVLLLSIFAVVSYAFFVFQPVLLHAKERVIIRVDESGNADVEWVFEIPPSDLADLMRLNVVGGTMGGIPFHGMGVENAKLMFSASTQSSFAKFGVGMENFSCDISGLGAGETFRITMRWRIPYLAHRRENMWVISFQPVDNESYAYGEINEVKNLQATLSVIAKDSKLSITSEWSILLPAGAEIFNEDELLALGVESVDYGGGTVESTSVSIQKVEGSPAVVEESWAVVTPQLITLTPEQLLEATTFYTIEYVGITPAHGFDGSVSWVATDMKFGREREKYTVSLDGREFDLTPHQLLYYSAKRVVALAENTAEPLLSGAQPISVLPPEEENGDWGSIFKTLTKAEYVAHARNIRDHIALSRKAPEKISTSIGTIRTRDALFTFLNVISFYHEHGELPESIILAPAPTGDLLKNGTEIPASHAYFLLNTQYAITGTPRVNQIVSDIRELDYDEGEVAEGLCTWVYENVTYDLVLGWFTSEEVLDARKGKCLDKTNLYLALTRTAGIPARRVSGFLIFEEVTYPFIQIAGVTPDGRFIIGHSWAEVYLPPEGWVFVDPTENLFKTCAYENEIYSSVQETWQEVLASYETAYGKLI